MKTKHILLSAMVMAFGITCQANAIAMQDPTPIPLLQKKDTIADPNNDTSEGDEEIPHAPIRRPSVAQDGHTLYLYSGCDYATIQLIDQSETVVFTEDVPEGTETLLLPSYLTGVFELRIIRGSFTFVAEIEL